MYKSIVIFCLWILPIVGNAQRITLKITDSSSSNYNTLIDTTYLRPSLQNQLEKYRSAGYLGAQIDSLHYEKDTIIAHLSKGRKYTHVQITKNNLPEGYLDKTGPSTLDLSSFAKLQRKVMQDYENNGYPFISLTLTHNQINRDTLSTHLYADPYLYFVYDSFVFQGNATISKKYLSKYLAIEKGKPYREKDILELDSRLQNLALIQLKSPSQVIFNRGIVQVILHIDDATIDRFDGIVGLAPNSENSSQNSLLVTGEVNVGLHNLFRTGKQLNLQWKNYLQNSQKLDLALHLPYLFNTRLGVTGEFKLNKFDTLFVNLSRKLSIRYQDKGNNYFQFYYQRISSNLINADTNAIRIQQRIPDNNPFAVDNYGMTLFKQKLDYITNPQKGFSLLTDASIGQKTIERNRDIARMKFVDSETGKFISLYDTIQSKHIRFDIRFQLSSYIPIKRKGTLHQHIAFRGLFSDQIFFNELHNFGGYSTLKGFDENAFFASKSLRYTLEYRYLIGQNSFVGLFINMAAYENKIDSPERIKDTPWGIGIASNLEVGQGILNIAYALGTQQGNGFQFNAAKIHFGIINYF